MYQVTASIVIYKNDREELLKAIHSFLNTEMNVKLFLIDNSPTDEIKTIIPQDSRIEYAFQGENLGFGKAHNIVMEKVRNLSTYHLVLNPDIYFETGVIEALYDYMEKNENVGLISPDIFLPSGERAYSCRLLPKPSTLISRRLWPASSKDIYTKVSYDKPLSSPWVSGCFMFVRTSLFDKIGLFDERYFMYCEDLDYSRRVHSSKMDIVYYPMVKAIHVFHRDSAKSFKMLLIHISSAFKYFTKWGWFCDKERDEINEKSIQNLVLVEDEK
ncbi:MAG: glycosyltransferase family 2 protein [Paludibacteraceae bacterium]|nr:glycosyltransferase family 2 protein [Paludibacteraceae bacterium]